MSSEEGTKIVEKGSESKRSQKRGGRFCVAGLPNGESCKNTCRTPSVNLHRFPKDPAIRRQWTNFVKRHRADFNPNSYSAHPHLCSDHFTGDSYTKALAQGLQGYDASHTKTFLKREAVPTIFDPPKRKNADKERHSTSENKSYSEREKRKLLRAINKDNSKETESDEQLIFPWEYGASEQAINGCPYHVTGAPVANCLECAADQTTGNLVDQIKEKGESRGTQVSLRCQRCKLTSRQNDNLKRKNLRLLKKIEVLEKEVSRQPEDTQRYSELEDLFSESDDSLQYKIDDDEIEEIDDEDDADDEDENRHFDDDNDEVRDNDDDDADDDEDEEFRTNHFHKGFSKEVRCDTNATPQEQPKFIVFYCMLLSLFKLFCFKCKQGVPEVRMESNGTMVTVYQSCSICGKDSFKWRSQPFIFGRYPAGNLMLSVATLCAGASISKVLLVFRHMCLSAYSARTYFLHQKKFLIPSILRHWEIYSAGLVEELQSLNGIVISGDGRFDSMGHSAKYGAYTIFCEDITKIVHFELIQANECKSSSEMELVGAKRCFSSLEVFGIKIATFISDRHTSISKWIRESFPSVLHFFDIWHVARTITKKLSKAGKERGCERINSWTSAIRKHLYWCVISTQEGFGDLILAKWRSFANHISNEHTNFKEKLFSKCAHGELEKRKWIYNGTIAHEKICSVLLEKHLLNDIKKLSPKTQTSCLEGYHSLLNHWHPKLLHFPWIGSLCRHILAISHFNENLQRKVRTNKDGIECLKVSFPKYKLGEEAVKAIRIQPTYGYVNKITMLLFSMTSAELEQIAVKYNNLAPKNFISKFENRASKQQAVTEYKKRKGLVTALYPEESEQSSMKAELAAEALFSTAQPAKKKRKAPTCLKCGKPMRGHPKGPCIEGN